MKKTNLLLSFFLIALIHSQIVDITNYGGTVTAPVADSPPGEGLLQAFDNSANTKFLTFHPTVWISFRGTQFYLVNKYAITSANDVDARDPKDWLFQGSNDGASWITLDSRTNEDFPTRFLRREFSFVNNQAYIYYRLFITANNAGNIIQFAELEIYGMVPTPGAIFFQHCSYGGYAVPLPEGVYNLSSIVLVGGVNNDISSLKVACGHKATIYDLDALGGSSLSLTDDDNCLVNEGWNDRATSLKVEKDPNVNWNSFALPTVVIVNNAPSHPGSQIFNTALSDPVNSLRNIVLEVVKKLHCNVNDNIRTLTKITVILEDFEGVSNISGTPPEITIRLSLGRLVNVYSSTNDYNAVRTEILGIFAHESSHGYLYEPKNAGSTTGYSEYFGFVEGMADYVRISLGLYPGSNPTFGPQFPWRVGYTTSGYFIKWLVTRKDPDFAIKFQHTARTYITFTWDAATTEILGQGVQALWNEYQNWLFSGKPV